ncbi:hemin uptake protein HemP [Roseibium litorale]|uniref:Hemin uptake protein HemP n=1 Tax=Roseibium litorale TaxID=2803841 RepID=A0ABR9CN03_9HYPH|nr:hemin uptake protein HemP [Roseibium litorale]MBD8892253.1 hemin uptake protein HemP [Roseibium litorale]
MSNIRRDKLTLSLNRPGSSQEEGSKDLVLDTKSLFRGKRELKIQHNEETYRLTITKLGKLILTK